MHPGRRATADVPGTYTFRWTVANGSCVSFDEVNVTFLPLSVGGSINSAQTICIGSVPSDLTLQGAVGNVVRWEKSSDAAFSNPVAIADTTTTLTGAAIGPLTADTWFRAFVQSGTCSGANSGPVKITVNNPAPVITRCAADRTLVAVIVRRQCPILPRKSPRPILAARR